MTANQTLPGFASPAAGFDQPFELLSACHDKVRNSLALLDRLQAYLADHAMDEPARRAARDVLRYFAIAAPAHHEDEERHVVPVLRQSGDPRLQVAAEQILSDHWQIRWAWQDLAPLLEQVASGQTPDAQRLSRAAARFAQLHGNHLALEDELLFPRARQLLELRGADALAEMGREMARRRLVGN